MYNITCLLQNWYVLPPVAYPGAINTEAFESYTATQPCVVHHSVLDELFPGATAVHNMYSCLPSGTLTYLLQLRRKLYAWTM